MKHVPCGICGSDDTSPFCSAKCPDMPSGAVFNAVQCKNCGLVYVSPRPETNELAAFYFDDYYGGGDGKKPGPAGLALALFCFLRKKRVLKYRKSGRILDVGCGDGTFLSSMRTKDWEVFGVETSESGVRSCVQKGIAVRKDLAFADGFFDAVTMWQSLEHFETPAAGLKEVRRVLSETGVLILSVPNIASAEYRLFQTRWFHLDLPRHLYHFSPATLNRLLEQSGFRIVETDFHSFEYNPYSLLQTIMNVFTPDLNFFYNLVKRNKIRGKRTVLNMAATGFALVFFTIPAFCLSYVFSFLKRSGVIHVYAEKIR